MLDRCFGDLFFVRYCISASAIAQQLTTKALFSSYFFCFNFFSMAFRACAQLRLAIRSEIRLSITGYECKTLIYGSTIPLLQSFIF